MKKIIAWLLAFLLTGALILFCAAFTLRLTLIPAFASTGAPVPERVAEAEKGLIRERTSALAELHGFTPGPVADWLTGSALTELNEQASLWWSSVLADGNTGVKLKLDTRELREILADDPLLQEREDPEAEAETLADLVSEDAIRVVLPLRQEIMTAGLREAGKRVDLVNLVTFALQVPWTALALSALLAGLIALTALWENRRLSTCLKYIGSALGAAALVLVVSGALAALAGVRPMILEASRSLAVQYDSVLTGVLLRLGACALVLLAGCVLCLILYRRSLKKHEA